MRKHIYEETCNQFQDEWLDHAEISDWFIVFFSCLNNAQKRCDEDDKDEDDEDENDEDDEDEDDEDEHDDDDDDDEDDEDEDFDNDYDAAAGGTSIISH